MAPSFKCVEEKLISKLIFGISKLLNFYSSNFKDMNLDGIYGLRILQGNNPNVCRCIMYEVFEVFINNWFYSFIRYLFIIISKTYLCHRTFSPISNTVINSALMIS